MSAVSNAADTSVEVKPSDVEKRGVENYDPEREPIQAYLRIRPPPPGTPVPSYLEVTSSSEVVMVPPADHRLNPSASGLFGGSLIRSSTALSMVAEETPPPSPAPFGTVYKFTQVFSPSSPSIAADSQASFFRETTLPMVKDFLGGQDCLLFAYGPTGSGKTWTVQGGEGEHAGILPRAMDVIWRSLDGKESKSGSRSTRLTGIDGRAAGSKKEKPFIAKGPNARASLNTGPTPEVIPVAEGYEYSIWVSYAEIYNEKIYDLLEAPLPTPSASTSSSASHSMFSSGLGLLSAGGARAKAMVRGFSTVKRNALSLKQDKTAGKYVHGMKEMRVHSAEEARAILDRGQQNRRVFSTLANRVSSRSHSVFTIKVVKVVKGGDPEDPSVTNTSRFSIVDLAGSERHVNTGATGDRLKEACNINQSLMVLGQCMDVLRKNQEREKGRKPAIVPFRHSKLTELFQSFFVGDGKAAMIVNINPYDTGFDENSHVMKFSAVAKGVLTAKDAPLQPFLPPPKKEPRVARLSMIDGEEEQDVIYEEDEEDEDSDDDPVVNVLVEALNTTRAMLFETQLKAALSESQVRAETVREYEEKMQELEKYYQQRMREEALQMETKFNAKIDILTRLEAERQEAETTFDDDENEDDSDSELDDEENVEKSLLHDASLVLAGDNSTSIDDMSPTAPAGRRAQGLSVDSPLATSRPAAPQDESFSDDSEDSINTTVSDAGAHGAFALPLDDDENDNYGEADEDEMAPEAAPKGLAKARDSTKRWTLGQSTAENLDGYDSDSFFDKSIVIEPKSKVAKKTRKLGAVAVNDVEAIDELGDLYEVPKSNGGKSVSAKSSSLKSLRR